MTLEELIKSTNGVTSAKLPNGRRCTVQRLETGQGMFPKCTINFYDQTPNKEDITSWEWMIEKEPQ